MSAHFQKRRNFLKTAAAGAIGITAAKFDKVFASSSGGWVSGMQINPAIDNKRVICCHDTKMLPNVTASTNWSSQNTAVDADVIASNMDQMAMRLAQKTTAADAWSAIFRSSKPWASTKVAIKTNAITGTAGNHPRVAIIKKICDVLVDQFGVLPANIVLYDATDDASTIYTSFYASLTDKTKIRATVSVKAQSLGGMTPVTIKSANPSKPISCVANLVNGTIDILVDIAVCKAHNGPGGNWGYGSVTLCMKNHLGTFNNTNGAGGADGLHSIPAICEINQHAAILGGTPVRQQLCIVDALLSTGDNPGHPWDNRTDRIIMGTFAPIVDYCTATNILLNKSIITVNFMEQLGVTNAAANLPLFLTNFGYTVTDVKDSWIEYIPGTGVVNPQSRERSDRVLQVALSNPSYRRAESQFSIPRTAGAMQLHIIDGRGRLMRTLSATPDETMIVWDGKTNSGTTVSAGNYIVKIIAGTLERAGSIVVSK